MFRFVLPLLLMLVVAAAALVMPSSQVSLTGFAKSGHIDCMNHYGDAKADIANSGIKQDCYAAKPCSSCKLCHVCPHAALIADAGLASSILIPLFTQPTQSAVAWLSAAHAPDFKPPIL